MSYQRAVTKITKQNFLVSWKVSGKNNILTILRSPDHHLVLNKSKRKENKQTKQTQTNRKG